MQSTVYLHIFYVGYLTNNYCIYESDTAYIAIAAAFV